MPDITILGPERVGFLLEPPSFLDGHPIVSEGRVVSPGDDGWRKVLAGYAEEIARGELEALGAMKGGEASGVILWRLAEWDTAVVGRPISRIVLACGEYLNGLLEFWKCRAKEMGVSYSTVRFARRYTLPGGSPGILMVQAEELERALECSGFSFLEDILVFEADVEEHMHGLKPFGGVAVEDAAEGDREEIVDIASHSYSFDRFHRDPYFSREEADAVHGKWAEDSLSGRADIVLVARESSGKVVGYVTAITSEKAGGFGWIDMLAVRKEYRNRGIGRLLIAGICRSLGERGIYSASLATQSLNKPALNLYRSCGFELQGELRTYRMAMGDAG